MEENENEKEEDEEGTQVLTQGSRYGLFYLRSGRIRVRGKG
jgi:hypothetical protein